MIKLKFVTRTNMLLDGTSDISIGNVSMSIPMITTPDTINCHIYIYFFIYKLRQET